MADPGTITAVVVAVASLAVSFFTHVRMSSCCGGTIQTRSPVATAPPPPRGRERERERRPLIHDDADDADDDNDDDDAQTPSPPATRTRRPRPTRVRYRTFNNPPPDEQRQRGQRRDANRRRQRHRRYAQVTLDRHRRTNAGASPPLTHHSQSSRRAGMLVGLAASSSTSVESAMTAADAVLHVDDASSSRCLPLDQEEVHMQVPAEQHPQHAIAVVAQSHDFLDVPLRTPSPPPPPPPPCHHARPGDAGPPPVA